MGEVTFKAILNAIYMNEINKKIIASDEDVILRELEESDLEFLAKYANNENVSMNLRDGFPKQYTLDDAKKFKQMIDSPFGAELSRTLYRGLHPRLFTFSHFVALK